MALGFEALFSNQPTTSDNGLNNTAVGTYAMRSNTHGGNNTAIGYNALRSNTTGTSNTAVGLEALRFNWSGINNTAVGLGALYSNNGFYNTTKGYKTLYSNTSGSSNTALGREALFSNTIGYDNTAIGRDALRFNNIGFSNTAIGHNSLTLNINGQFSTAIGRSSNVSMEFFTNTTAIGANTTVNNSDKVRIGNSNVNVIEGQVDWSFPSDARFKYNIQDDNIPGLSFIQQLHPVTFQFDTRKYKEHVIKHFPDSLKQEYLSHLNESDVPRIQTGFLAQEVEQLCKELNYEFSGLHIPENDTDNYSLAFGSFVPTLVKAMQEQQVLIDELREQNKRIQAQYTGLQDMIFALENKLR